MSSESFFEALKHSESDPSKTRLAIVGGGLAGILLALRLTKDEKTYKPGDITLIEAMPTLGGRTFFSSPLNLSGMKTEERFHELLRATNSRKGLSGFGFEVFFAESLAVYERHLQGALHDDELAFVESFCEEHARGDELAHSCYFVKKEFTPFAQMMSGSSEMLTKHEAEAFASLCKFEGEGELAESDETLEHSAFWKELPKNRKEVLSPILETFFGEPFLKVSFSDVRAYLGAFHQSVQVSPPTQLVRHSGLELALELVLRRRGIRVRTACNMTKLVQMGDKSFRLSLMDEVEPLRRELFSAQVVFALPLAKAFTFLPREWLTPAQSKFVSKVRPKSLLAAEFTNFREVVGSSWPEHGGLGTRLVFTVERAQAFVTSQGSLVLHTMLEFEESLHAPAVREALSRLRRAAARVLRPEVQRAFEGGKGIPKDESKAERIVLLPVAYTVPYEVGKTELTECKLAHPGLYVCGDGFGFGFRPWKNVVNSVSEVSLALTKQ